VDGKRHRVDGPAYEYADGSRQWWMDGKRHRVDGPAVEWADGSRQWWVDGERLSEEQFEKHPLRLEYVNSFEGDKAKIDHKVTPTLFKDVYCGQTKHIDKCDIKECLPKFNVGDIVFASRHGWLKVAYINKLSDYKIECKRVGESFIYAFTEDGKVDSRDLYSSLFTKGEAAVMFPMYPVPSKLLLTSGEVYIGIYADGGILPHLFSSPDEKSYPNAEFIKIVRV
jgi:hypothetical protein